MRKNLPARPRDGGTTSLPREKWMTHVAAACRSKESHGFFTAFRRHGETEYFRNGLPLSKAAGRGAEGYCAEVRRRCRARTPAGRAKVAGDRVADAQAPTRAAPAKNTPIRHPDNRRRSRWDTRT